MSTLPQPSKGARLDALMTQSRSLMQQIRTCYQGGDIRNRLAPGQRQRYERLYQSLCALDQEIHALAQG